MKFRPRYSLLTLLVLTALVASGLKLWRGPHWRELNDPCTASEELLLKQHPSFPDLRLFFPMALSCEYYNTFQGPELLRIKGHPAELTQILVVDWSRKDTPQKFDAPTNYDDLMLVGLDGLDQDRKSEKIRCWYSTTLPLPKGQKTGSQLAPTCSYLLFHF